MSRERKKFLYAVSLHGFFQFSSAGKKAMNLRRFFMGPKGFTLIELTVVVFLLTLIFMVVLPNMEAFSPTFKLRSLAREIGSTLEEARSEAALKGEKYGIRYDFENRQFGLLLPENFGLGKGLSGSKREVLQYHTIDRELLLEAIILPDNKRLTSGVEDMDFDPLGKEGSHIVVIKTRGGKTMWIKFNSFTGLVTYSQKELTFRTYEGD